MVKRLLIKASNNYTDDFQIVPINTLIPISIPSDIGDFELLINIKNFDGCKFHRANSLYNIGDHHYLDQNPFDGDSKGETPSSNLNFEVNFKPKLPINGKDCLFGNDFSTPIKDYVPTTLLSAGLKFFNWFINGTVRGDIYSDKPFLYGPILNSCTYMAINETIPFKYTATDSSVQKLPENLKDNSEEDSKIPEMSLDRKKYFNKLASCESFVFNENNTYKLMFDTNFIKMADSKYSVSIPTYNSNTFDINVSSYANDKLNNFNWVIKLAGLEGVGCGRVGLVVNFALIDED